MIVHKSDPSDVGTTKIAAEQDRKEVLFEELKNMGVPPTDQQIEQLLRYMDLVLDRNQHINLTAIRDPEEFLLRHYVDSAAVMILPEYRNAKNILDLGTGAGFPGVPLAILSPEKEFILVDALQKRLKVISEFTEELGIHNVEVVHSRAEDLGRNRRFREQLDLCVSRAVADLSVLSEYCLPLVRVGGSFIAYKGSDIQEEIDGAEKAIGVLGGKLDQIHPVSVAGTDHTLVVIQKEKHTPKTYPRKAGTPGKFPIK